MLSSASTLLQKGYGDFPWYAEHFLKIRARHAAVAPFILNAEQLELHRRLEQQKLETGRVRALIVKSRQVGISTYCAARALHYVLHHFGVRAFTMTHRRDSTLHVASMIHRFHAHLPDFLKPMDFRRRDDSFFFPVLDSGFRFGTAGGQHVGRGETFHFFHGSEVAFWTHGADHVSASMVAVPDAMDTEILLESTANGIHGIFHGLCLEGAAPADFSVIFLPWFWHGDYVAPAMDSIPKVFRDYGDLHKLSDAQLAWAYHRNRILCAAAGDDPNAGFSWRFHQEFPATLADAFSAQTQDSFIPYALIHKTLKNPVVSSVLSATSAREPLILGVDVARGGGDLSWIIDRQGSLLGTRINQQRNIPDSMGVVSWISSVIDRLSPSFVFIDMGGNGAAVYDRLRELGYGRLVHLIAFGGKPYDPRQYANKRAEMWGLLLRWLKGSVWIPNDSLLHQHFTAPRFRFNHSGQLLLESKDSIHARLGFSPDGGDAAALTFAGSLSSAPVRYGRVDDSYSPV